jgi:Transposase DDE domain
MSCRETVSQWERTVSMNMPHLSGPQAKVLAVWSAAMILGKSCGTTTAAYWLAHTIGGSYDAWRQRLREWCYDAPDKKGKQREEVSVVTCFAPLLRWILTWWATGEHRLALAMDASTLSERFTVLAISVVYRGCAIPVAWCMVGAGKKGAWQPDWIALFDCLGECIPANWTVIVLADRGLYARWLYQQIQRQGWHPFLRINLGGKARPKGTETYHWLASFAPVTGYEWCGEVRCFTEASSRLDCTLLARWDEQYKDPWLILTDLLPAQADVAWYAMRAWIECGFKDTKRGGWNWHHTKMQDPARAERHWLVMAVATLWVVSVGGESDATQPASTLDALPPDHIARRLCKQRNKQRKISCFARGVMMLTLALLQGESLPTGQFVPFSWPLSPPQTEDEGRFCSQGDKTYP